MEESFSIVSFKPFLFYMYDHFGCIEICTLLVCLVPKEAIIVY